jgi:hypothetical protein
VAVLDYIQEKLKGSTRPRVDLADMKRLRQVPSPKPEEQMTTSDGDVLTTAAKAIGTTLGKIAVKTGIAKPPATTAKTPKKVAVAKKATKRMPAAKTAVGAKGKTASKRSPKKPTPLASGNKPAPKR